MLKPVHTHRVPTADTERRITPIGISTIESLHGFLYLTPPQPFACKGHHYHTAGEENTTVTLTVIWVLVKNSSKNLLQDWALVKCQRGVRISTFRVKFRGAAWFQVCRKLEDQLEGRFGNILYLPQVWPSADWQSWCQVAQDKWTCQVWSQYWESPAGFVQCSHVLPAAGSRSHAGVKVDVCAQTDFITERRTCHTDSKHIWILSLSHFRGFKHGLTWKHCLKFVHLLFCDFLTHQSTFDRSLNIDWCVALIYSTTLSANINSNNGIERNVEILCDWYMTDTLPLGTERTFAIWLIATFGN